MNTAHHHDAAQYADLEAEADALLASEILEHEIATMVGDAAGDVCGDLVDDLDGARTERERDALETLLSTAHSWLDAHFRDHLTGSTTPSPAAAEADRLWSVVTAERATPGYDKRPTLLEIEADEAFLADIAY